jgi:hypothetical protein
MRLPPKSLPGLVVSRPFLLALVLLVLPLPREEEL